MSNVVGVYNLRPAVKGDTWDGIALSIQTNGVPDDLTGYTIQMLVEQPGNNTAALDLNTTNSGITITNAPAGEFEVAPFLMTLNAGVYEYRVILTDGSGRRKTRIKGNWKIVEV